MTGKSQDALRTIGEASKELGVKAHILRYWEEQFPMLEPLKRAGSRRYYRAEDMALLKQIDELLNRQGYTVKGAINFLKNRDNINPAPAPDTAPAMPQLSDDKVRQLQDIRATLADALAIA